MQNAKCKTLYLGLDPTRWPGEVVHYPVIRTERLEVALDEWPRCTHVVFTSRSAVRHWWEIGVPFGQREAIAIGEATAQELQERDVVSLVAKEATQEGMIALLEELELGHVFLPRSRRARDVLPRYLEERGVPFYICDLYDTILQKLQPIDLREFEEIVFTSPSTVEGFLQIFGKFPSHCKLTPIGPITQNALRSAFCDLHFAFPIRYTPIQQQQEGVCL